MRCNKKYYNKQMPEKEGNDMNQTERRNYLIKELLKEQPRYRRIEIPQDNMEQTQLLRSLMNIRIPQKIETDFLEIQDAYLQEEIEKKGITDWNDLKPVEDGIYLWQGDITTLRCDAVVNAANHRMTGCYVPCHSCIDNCIHTFSGIQLRLVCDDLMKQQGHEEETGKAKITPAFNLPCKYILHTVGPIISKTVQKKDEELLASCYRSCLELAEQNQVKSIAFCCISTGEFHFPNETAAKIAVQTVREYKTQKKSRIEVIFNVFKENDYEIYKRIFSNTEKWK